MNGYKRLNARCRRPGAIRPEGTAGDNTVMQATEWLKEICLEVGFVWLIPDVPVKWLARGHPADPLALWGLSGEGVSAPARAAGASIKRPLCNMSRMTGGVFSGNSGVN